MTTCFNELDKVLDGFNDGELIILGGRPGMGKSSLAIDIARNCKGTVLYISLEASQPQYLKQVSNIIWIPECCSSDLETERQTKPLCKISEIRKCVATQKDDIDLIIIDYIQLINSTEPIKEIKELAQDINKPILALSQLSRSVEQREDHRPIITDFSIESQGQFDYVDKVLLLYRHDYYDCQSQTNIAEVTVYRNPHLVQDKAFLRYEATGDGLHFFS